MLDRFIQKGFFAVVDGELAVGEDQGGALVDLVAYPCHEFDNRFRIANVAPYERPASWKSGILLQAFCIGIDVEELSVAAVGEKQSIL